jgi:hypothetical protein
MNVPVYVIVSTTCFTIMVALTTGMLLHNTVSTAPAVSHDVLQPAFGHISLISGSEVAHTEDKEMEANVDKFDCEVHLKALHNFQPVPATPLTVRLHQ